MEKVFVLKNTVISNKSLGELCIFPIDVRCYLYNMLSISDIESLAQTSKSLYQDIKHWFNIYCNPLIVKLLEFDGNEIITPIDSSCDSCGEHSTLFQLIKSKHRFSFPVHRIRFEKEPEKEMKIYYYSFNIYPRQYQPTDYAYYTEYTTPSGAINTTKMYCQFCFVCLCKKEPYLGVEKI